MSSSAARLAGEARACVDRGDDKSARVIYGMVLRNGPPRTGADRIALGEAYCWHARDALKNNMPGEALDWYLRAVNADPLFVDCRLEYVGHLLEMGCLKNARVEAERSVKIDPQNPDCWNALGEVLKQACDAGGSIAAYERALEIDPGNPQSRFNRAVVAFDTADYGTTTEMVRPLLHSYKHRGAALYTLAMVAYRRSEHEEAIEQFTQALDAGCPHPEMVRWNRSLAEHAIGRYKEGWADHERRGAQRADQAMALVYNRFTVPILALDVPRGSKVHVHQEMGAGDTFAMARYLPLLVERGYRVTFEVTEPMVALMARSLPEVQVVPRAMDYPSAFGVPGPLDYHVPALSLPYIFGTDVDTVPWSGPYLIPNQELVDNYGMLAGYKSFKVGICWSSGIREEGLWLKEYGQRKSLPFKKLRPIFGTTEWVMESGTEFYCLQVGPERAEQDKAFVDDLLPLKPTWDDTAALIANLDLVITVDTSVAHLAGAMGKETWVMCQRDAASWHFMCWRPGAAWNERSPWYPSARVFRQREFNRPHHWDDVVKDVANELERRTHG